MKARAFTTHILLTGLVLTSFASTSQALLDSVPRGIAASSSDSKERTRLEELVIWKVSEELKLAPKDEQKFTDIVHQLNADKRKATEKMEQAVRDLNQVKTKAEAEKVLARHRAALRQYQSLQLAELDKLKPLLGAERLARYIVVKNEITEKLKALLASSSSSPAPTAGASPTPPAGVPTVETRK